jgi:hypothetical protein
MLNAAQQMLAASIFRRFDVFVDVMPEDIPLVHVETGGSSGAPSRSGVAREASMPRYEVDIGHRTVAVRAEVAHAVKIALEEAGVPVATPDDVGAFRGAPRKLVV